MNWRLDASARRFGMVSRFPFQVMLSGFAAQGEVVCKSLGGWPRAVPLNWGYLKNVGLLII